MKNWTFTLEDGSEVTVYEHAIACIHWRYELQPVRMTPDHSRIVLTNGQMVDLLRENTVRLHDDIVSQI